MIQALVMRDMILTLRTGAAWLMGLVFFSLFLTLCALALGGAQGLASEFMSSLIWLALILSATLSFAQIFEQDYMDGTLEQISLTGISYMTLCIAKTLSFALAALLPLWCAIPLAALVFDISAPDLGRILVATALALPAIAAYGVFASAITVTRRMSGIWLILISLPFLIPVLIFGISAVNADGFHVALRALAGLSLISCAIGLPAAASALKTAYE